MAETTNTHFNANTEALEIADAFSAGIRGKTIIITGVNRGGIGFSTAHAFASQAPAHVIITGRSREKLEVSIEALKAEFPAVDYRPLQLDLSDQQSVRKAAKEVLAWPDVPAIDILVNSAGVMGIQDRTLNKDGIEMHFATNHIGHFLFTGLILQKLIKAAEGSPWGATRIVNVSSASPMHSSMRWSDMTFEKKNKELPEAEQPDYAWFGAWGYIDIENQTYIPLDGYNRSKVANVLFAVEANKRLFDAYGILSLAVHPGVINTELGRNFPAETFEAIKKMLDQGLLAFKTLGAGASTSLVAALDPKLANEVGEAKSGSENWGVYLEDCQISGQACALALSNEEAARLWKISEGSVGEQFA